MKRLLSRVCFLLWLLALGACATAAVRVVWQSGKLHASTRRLHDARLASFEWSLPPVTAYETLRAQGRSVVIVVGPRCEPCANAMNRWLELASAAAEKTHHVWLQIIRTGATDSTECDTGARPGLTCSTLTMPNWREFQLYTGIEHVPTVIVSGSTATCVIAGTAPEAEAPCLKQLLQRDMLTQGGPLLFFRGPDANDGGSANQRGLPAVELTNNSALDSATADEAAAKRDHAELK